MIKMLGVVLLLVSSGVFAAPEVVITLKDHLFIPSKIQVPADKKIKLVIINQDPTPEEFDSFDLNREKVLFPGRRSIIYIGPLKPGEYHFFGEFNPNSAQGSVIAVAEGNDHVD
ncbi:hypothetical protein TK45_07625 [Bowmanella sp. JS7-9]|nr:hypothetical protein TK45_07625 [Bowmanella sp. JS7-9]